MMLVLSKVVLVLGLAASCYGESFSFCKLSDPDADTCLAKNIENALHLLKSGIPEYGLKPLDPLPVDKITIDSGRGPVQLVQYYKNIELLGFGDGTVSKAHYDGTKKTLTIKTKFPKITQQGDYTVDGKILTLPIKGQGKSTLLLEELEIGINIQFDEYQKEGQTYFKIKSFKVGLTPGKLVVKYERLFSGNSALGTSINKLINDEWKVVFNDVKESTDKAYGDVLRNYAQTFFDHVPVEKIFLK